MKNYPFLITIRLLAFSLFFINITPSFAAPYETNMMPPFSIKAEDNAKKSVYIQVRNTSDSPFLHVAEALRHAFEDYNYTIAKNPNEAYYIIHATIPQAGEITTLQHETLLSLGYGKSMNTAQMPVLPIIDVAPLETPEEEVPEITPLSADEELSASTTDENFTVSTIASETTAPVSIEPTVAEDKAAQKTEVDESLLLYSITLDMQVSIQQARGKRVRYQVRITTSTPKDNNTFQTIAPELSKHLAEGVVEIFR